MKTIINELKMDIMIFKDQSSFELKNFIYLLHPRLYPVILFRIASSLHKIRLGVISRLFTLLNQILFGCDIARSATIGGGLYLPHPQGVVVGAQAQIGNFCILHQGVTLGARGELHEDGDPCIKDYVEIGTGAKVLGSICIGKYCRIGANSVVLKDIPDFGVAVGLPAKLISYRSDRHELEGL